MDIFLGLLPTIAEDSCVGHRGVLSMLYRTMAMLLSGAIGVFVTGCATSTPTMRGQSPQEAYGASSGGPPMNHDCPMCQSGEGHGAANCQDPGCNLPCHPVHRNFHTYHAPQNLMYPPENAAPAQVQYPYYTFRGPTDFFMK
ncbi:MAG: hypothetical protein JW384_03433 [Nitrosomonadaceae bacterium]|nr:hypothetical protein [Nitrosomonadaceae bacterium]